jgi:hypothetical protein
MTGAERHAQRALVEASLLADEQRAHHHDVYSTRRRAGTPTTPGRQHEDDAPTSARPASTSASDGSESASTGRDGSRRGSAAPGRGDDAGDECPSCQGAGEIAFNPGYPDPQCADSMPCRECEGTGAAPAPRAVPGSTRVSPPTRASQGTP